MDSPGSLSMLIMLCHQKWAMGRKRKDFPQSKFDVLRETRLASLSSLTLGKSDLAEAASKRVNLP